MSGQTDTAPYVYLLLIEVEPERGKPYLEWLSGKHIREVKSCPGFVWARRIMFEEKATDGWLTLAVAYGLRSREDFLKYRESETLKRFLKEAKQFKGAFRIRRFFGPVDVSLD